MSWAKKGSPARIFLWGLLAFSFAAVSLWLGADLNSTSAQSKGKSVGVKTGDLGSLRS